MEKLSGLNDYFLAFESLTQVNFITRLKQEQSAIKDMDNPFEFYVKERGADEISLKPLDDLRQRLDEKIKASLKNS